MARSALEKWTLAFGIINVVIAALLFLLVVISMPIKYYVILEFESITAITSEDLFMYLRDLSFYLVYVIFAALLLNGVCKKKCKQVLAYFVFGLVLTISYMVDVVQFIMGSAMYLLITGIYLLLFLIHSVTMILVYKFYRKIKAETLQPKTQIPTSGTIEMEPCTDHKN